MKRYIQLTKAKSKKFSPNQTKFCFLLYLLRKVFISTVLCTTAERGFNGHGRAMHSDADGVPLR
jgi:hypothetical protein